MRCFMVGVLGVGGVGKTTYIYRLVGVPIQPKTTLRPGMYRTTIRETPVCILDVPGHRAIEVADALARAWPYYLDLAIYMYDVTDAYTLQSLLDIEQHLRSKVVKPYRGCVVVGNKVDLAKERHTFITAEDVAEALGALGVFYISALKDPYDKLIQPLKTSLEERHARCS